MPVMTSLEENEHMAYASYFQFDKMKDKYSLNHQQGEK